VIRTIEAEELRRLVPIDRAIDALEVAFRDEDPSLAAPLRSSLATPAGTLLVMPAAGGGGVGVKLVTLSEFNPPRGVPFLHAIYVLFDRETQRPEAVIDGTELTALRTAAVSGLATRYLARDAARRLVLFGAGAQAHAHLDAMIAVRPVEEVVVVSRSEGPAIALADRAEAMGLRAVVGTSEAVAEADLVCTCTTSAVPVFDGRRLAAGAHVNAVGAYLPNEREVDAETVSRARVVVETREVAFAEAGDLLLPIGEGLIDRDHVRADLSEVVGGAGIRTSDDDVTLFESVGMAFEDLVVARAALDEADRERRS
jgi:ornithine cyclodeaminase/alanine dehydrogenase-like protein (mu-crystallin family)